jgi:hypothetical protein
MIRIESAARLTLSERRRQIRRQRRVRTMREWCELLVIGLAGIWLAAFAAVALVAR